MNLDYVSQEELQRRVEKIFRQYLPQQNYRLFFFGSRIRGNNSPRSDIDLGVETPQGLSPKTKLEIEEELQNLPILYKIDLVDFSNVSEDFRKTALKNVEYLN